MPTLLGVFRDRTDTDDVVDRLLEHGVERDHIGLVWREKIVHTEEEIEVITYVDHFEGPAKEAKKGAWGGVIGGATAGIAGAILASAGLVLGPDVAAILGGGTAAAAAAVAAGAAGGGITGTAIGAFLGATDHGATRVRTVETERHDVTETDGFVLTIEADDDVIDQASEVLKDVGATDITILGGDGSKLRVHID